MSFVGKKGVDISSNNGSVDIAKIKSAGYDFVMIRCGFGENITSQDDNRWEENVRKCEAAGMPWGAYFYSYACSESSAKSEHRSMTSQLSHLPMWPLSRNWTRLASGIYMICIPSAMRI